MSELDFLIIENDERWHRVLRDVLSGLGGEVELSVAGSYAEAARQAGTRAFDLATVDLSLSSDPADPARADDKGMELLAELRRSTLNRHCGLVVLTGYPKTATMRQALRDYGVYNYVEKDEFDPAGFLDIVRDALLDARAQRADARLEQSYRLNISMGEGRLLWGELRGPARRSVPHEAAGTPPARIPNLIRRADNLDLLLRYGGPDVWRPEAKDIGGEVHRILAGEQQVWGDFRAAQNLAESPGDVWLQLAGPPEALGFPLELMRDDNDFFAHAHAITRSLVHPEARLSRNVEPFHTFLHALKRRGGEARALVVGANPDGRLASVDYEVFAVKRLLEANFKCLGIRHEVVPLAGADATYENFRRSLTGGRFHLLHFAGHGRFNASLPEGSGLMLSDGAGGARAVTAHELSLLTPESGLQLAFLNCCLGARAARAAGRGDFYGTVEALVKADVPIVLSHRWSVADGPAGKMAETFYAQLWRTLLPAAALLQARLTMRRDLGGDDHTWASPVLVMQNA